MILIPPEQHWVCPRCTKTACTRGQANRYHPCPGVHGVVSPMVLEGTRCKLTAVEREDYIGGEDVQCDDDGRPITAVLITRDDGEDCTVYAPTVWMKVGD